MRRHTENRLPPLEEDVKELPISLLDLTECLQLDTNILVRYQVVKSSIFLRWLKGLRDRRAQARIAVRIDRIEEGNLGDHKPVGQGVSEMRVPVGKGYRVYYTIRGNRLVILLCGGDKSSQQQDIRHAQQMVSEL